LIKILHVFGRMQRGGAEMRTLELMPLLAQKNVRFDFCTLLSGPGSLDEKIRQLGGAVYPCPLKSALWSFGKRFARLLRQNEYDIVHSHVHYASGYMVRLASKAGIRGRIVHFRSIYDGKPLTLHRRLYRRLMLRWARRHATAVLAVCRGVMEFGWGPDWCNDPRCRVIYNGLDLQAFDRVTRDRKKITAEWNIPETAYLWINVASFRPPKAHDILLKAAFQLSREKQNVHILLVGDGPLREQMENQAIQLSIDGQVHFAGLRNDVPALLKAADAFVLPSRWEGLPGVVLEAIAAGLPVVATDLPGTREIAEHTHLVTLVPKENPHALAREMARISSQHDDHLVREKSAFPETFDLTHCARNLYEVYHQQVDKPPQ